MATNRRKQDPTGVVKELEDIKRLLMLALMRDGAKQSEIATVLGVTQQAISRMFPGGIAKTVKPKA